ncbi:hypothetical protein EBZ80_15750 [bacterium]|nr:hypothetical protein [bacterium]
MPLRPRCPAVPAPPALNIYRPSLDGLGLKNIAIYPSRYATAVSSGTLNWANVNFQVIGESGKRVWEFKGAGTTSADTVRITYTTKTVSDLGFEGFVSGTITSDGHTTAMSATKYAAVSASSANDVTTVMITISGLGVLGQYGYTIYVNDSFSSALSNITGGLL